MRPYHYPMSSNARRAVMTALEPRVQVALVLVEPAKAACVRARDARKESDL